MTEIDTLRPLLDAIPTQDILEPNMPIAVLLQEANDLHHQLEAGDTWLRMLAVGAEPTAPEGLATAVAGARQAQSQWVVVRDRGKPQAQRDREQAGITLRSDLVAACRWNLRREPTAQAVLDEIVQGDGIPDLIQDLVNLAALVDRHEASFDADETFDAPMQAEAARSAAEELTAGLSASRTAGDHAAAKALRDRAFTHLAALVSDLRDAGRYAFRKEPRRAAVFGSEYQRRAHAKARRRALELSAGSTEADASTNA